MGQPLGGKKAREVMRAQFLSVEPDATVADAVRLMHERNAGAVVVQSAIKDMVGIFTERDLLRRVVAGGKDPVRTRVRDVMTANVVCAQAEDDAWELLRVMLEANFRHLPVMDGRQLIGMVSLKEFCRGMIREIG